VYTICVSDTSGWVLGDFRHHLELALGPAQCFFVVLSLAGPLTVLFCQEEKKGSRQASWMTAQQEHGPQKVQGAKTPPKRWEKKAKHRVSPA
jgi:hypothetical protein